MAFAFIILVLQPIIAVLIIASMLTGFEESNRSNRVILTLYVVASLAVMFGDIGAVISAVLFIIGNAIWAVR